MEEVTVTLTRDEWNKIVEIVNGWVDAADGEPDQKEYENIYDKLYNQVSQVNQAKE